MAYMGGAIYADIKIDKKATTDSLEEFYSRSLALQWRLIMLQEKQ